MNNSSLTTQDELTHTTMTFMNKVYSWMLFAILVSAFTAYLTNYFMVDLIINTALGVWPKYYFGTVIYTAIILQLVVVVAINFLIKKVNATTARILFMIYAALVGISTSIVFLAYTKTDIINAFLIVAFAFGGLTTYGYYTKRDLKFIGTFCTMGLFGLVGFMLYGLFVPAVITDQVQMQTAIVSIIVFAGLTAFDTAKIKNLVLQKENGLSNENAAIFGALMLYLDFINLFLAILRLKKR